MTTLTPVTTSLNEMKAEVFSNRLLETLNGGAIALMISIGHRTGLFDLLAKLPPATSQTIADAVGLQERYVREWLGAMVTGQIIDYDCTDKTYYLPPEHAASLTRDAVSGNVAAFMQYVPLLGSIEDQIIYCFHCWAVSKTQPFNAATAMSAIPTQRLSA